MEGGCFKEGKKEEKRGLFGGHFGAGEKIRKNGDKREKGSGEKSLRRGDLSLRILGSLKKIG